MTRDTEKAEALVASWSANADRWSEAIRSRSIVSRRLVTDQAVVAAVLRHQPARVLDLGCGEGWLARALAPHVGTVVGVDASAELVAAARAAGGASFHRTSYDEIVDRPTRIGTGYDVVVANFALLGEMLRPLLSALTRIARADGTLVVQTLHPAETPPPYADGWREESFAGFGDGAPWRPMPWYFRTAGSWIGDIAEAWRVIRVEEPIHPETGRPASLLITAKAMRALD